MKAAKIIDTYSGTRARLYMMSSEAVGVVAADIPTGRNAAMTYDILMNVADFKDHIEKLQVDGHSRGCRPGYVVDIAGVKLLAGIYRDIKSPKYQDMTVKMLGWIEDKLVPEMEALQADRAPVKFRGSIGVNIGETRFQGFFLDLEKDTVTLAADGHLMTRTAKQLFQALGMIPGPGASPKFLQQDETGV